MLPQLLRGVALVPERVAHEPQLALEGGGLGRGVAEPRHRLLLAHLRRRRDHSQVAAVLLEDLVHNDLDLVDVLVGCVCEGTCGLAGAPAVLGRATLADDDVDEPLRELILGQLANLR